MLLRAGQVIAGRPAKDIRKLLREIRHLQVSSGYARDVIGCSMDEAKHVVSALEREGYLSRTGRHEGHDLYETTLKGNQLAGANLRPISRATAERTLQAFMQRVRAVNSDLTVSRRSLGRLFSAASSRQARNWGMSMWALGSSENRWVTRFSCSSPKQGDSWLESEGDSSGTSPIG